MELWPVSERVHGVEMLIKTSPVMTIRLEFQSNFNSRKAPFRNVGLKMA